LGFESLLGSQFLGSQFAANWLFILVPDPKFMQKTNTKPEDYIASLPAEKRPDVEKLDEVISTIMKGEVKVMWEGIFWGGSQQKIIGYGELIYHRSTGEPVEWFTVGLALQKNYITVFVNAVDNKEYVAEKYKKDLGKAKVGKSSISFKSLSDVNLDVLSEVIKKAKELSKNNG